MSRLGQSRERDEQIVRWWNEDGLSVRQIAQRLGWSIGRTSSELYRRLGERGHTIKRRRDS